MTEQEVEKWEIRLEVVDGKFIIQTFLGNLRTDFLRLPQEVARVVAQEMGYMFRACDECKHIMCTCMWCGNCDNLNCKDSGYHDPEKTRYVVTYQGMHGGTYDINGPSCGGTGARLLTTAPNVRPISPRQYRELMDDIDEIRPPSESQEASKLWREIGRMK